VIAITANAQIGAKTKSSNQLTGIWQNNEFGYQMTLIMNADGSGEFDGDEIKYVAKNGVFTLTIVRQQTTQNYNYTLNGNSLTLSGGDLEQPITMTRAGSQGESALATPPADPPTPPGGVDKNLFGAWYGNTESMEFKADGTCLYNGVSLAYSAINGQVTLTTQRGSAVIPYTVKGNELVMTVNGQQYTYNKGQASNKQPASTGNKSIPQELAGHWCVMSSTSSSSGGSFSSECIQLNPDGTYIYTSESSRSVNTPDLAGGTSSQGGDRGTWWMEGERLFYNSPTYGAGSYRLEKRNHPKNTSDPMIVLDGKAFVTTKLKPAWR